MIAVNVAPLFHEGADGVGDCEARIKLRCPACDRQVVYCHLDDARAVILAYRAGSWRCSSCAEVPS